MQRWGAAAIAAVAASAISAPARAQQGSAALAGRVVDAVSKRGISDAVVTVTSPALQGEQTVTTDETGRYRIPLLPPGAYVSHFEKDGFRAYRRDQIPLRSNATVRLDVELLPEGLEAEEVVVTARAPSPSPSIDAASSTVETSLDSDFASRVPITNPGARGGAQRTFESVVEAAPGASADLYGASISGASSPENAYIVDGLRTNNVRYGINGSPLTIEFVKEVHVLSSGYMPEYGRSTGGIVNVVTKSGSNDYHGSVWANWTPGALEGERKHPYFVGTAIQTRRSLGNVYDVGFDQSGPLVRDALWYYAGFGVSRAIYDLERSISKSTPGGPVEIVDARREYRASFTSYQVFFKLDWRADRDNRFALTFAATPTASGGGGDYSVNSRTGLVEGSIGEYNLTGSYGALAHTRRSGAYDAVLKWTSTFDNKSKSWETTLGWHRELGGVLGADGFHVGSGLGYANIPAVTYNRTSNAHGINDFESVPGCDPPNVKKAISCPVLPYRAGGPGAMSVQVLDTYALKSVLTVSARALGHHVIKAGAELEWATSWTSLGFSGADNVLESPSGATFSRTSMGYLTSPDNAVRFDRYVTRSHSLGAGGFIQDSWAVADKVTFNFGVRYDNQFIFGDDGKRLLTMPHQISPRMGLIVDPLQTGRSKLFASYARFYENVPLDIADVVTPSTTASFPSYAATPSAIRYPAQGGMRGGGIPDRVHASTFAGKPVVDPDLTPQSTSEISGGGEYELVKNGRLGVTYVRRWLNTVVEDMSKDEAMTYFIGNPGKGIAKDFPEARRDYDAGTIYFVKSFSDGWLAQTSYTLSWLRGNYSGLYQPYTGQLAPLHTVGFDLRSLMGNATGDLPGDRRHSVKLYGARDVKVTRDSTVQIGLSIQVRSGGPTSFRGAAILYGSDSVFLLPSGTGDRLPWNANVGTHLGWAWRFENGVTLSLMLDVFNLLNLHTALTRDERYTLVPVHPIPHGSRSDLPGKIKTDSGDPFTSESVNPNFGNATYYQEPRQFRFGLRGSF